VRDSDRAPRHVFNDLSGVDYPDGSLSEFFDALTAQIPISLLVLCRQPNSSASIDRASAFAATHAMARQVPVKIFDGSLRDPPRQAQSNCLRAGLLLDARPARIARAGTVVLAKPARLVLGHAVREVGRSCRRARLVTCSIHRNECLQRLTNAIRATAPTGSVETTECVRLIQIASSRQVVASEQ
jgi:hypothetical protein